MAISEGFLSFFDKLIEKFEKLVGHKNDPHGLKGYLMPGLGEIVTKVINDPDIGNKNSIKFLAHMYDNRKEKNLVEIVEKALPYVSKEADASKVEDDWFIDFMDKASKISNEEVQNIWARILAEEVNQPGHISKRLLHNLFIMGKHEAQSFEHLTAFCFYDRYSKTEPIRAFVFTKEAIFSESALTTVILKELEQLSLIELHYDGFTYHGRLHLYYKNHYFLLEAPTIPAGEVRLTEDGKTLFNIIEKINSDKVYDALLEIMNTKGVMVHQFGN